MTDIDGELGGQAPSAVTRIVNALTGVTRVVNAPLPTKYGDFQAVGYLDHDRGDEQVALVYGDIEEEVSLLIPPCENNITYRRTKRERLDHYLPRLDAVVHSS